MNIYGDKRLGDSISYSVLSLKERLILHSLCVHRKIQSLVFEGCPKHLLIFILIWKSSWNTSQIQEISPFHLWAHLVKLKYIMHFISQ